MTERRFCYSTYHPSDPAIAGRDNRPAVAAGSERLLAALTSAFVRRVNSTGCSFLKAQTYLMNGVEP